MIFAYVWPALISNIVWAAIQNADLKDAIILKTGLSAQVVSETLAFYSDHYHELRNTKYITIVDLNRHSGLRRFFVIDTSNGDVEALHTAHGKGSDLDNDGIAESFSNIPQSNKSTLGFTMTGETYEGKNGYSLRLYSMESINSQIFERAIVVHGADYVDPKKAKMGRSFGCPALTWSRYREVIDKIKEGSLFFFTHKYLAEARLNPQILMQPESPDFSGEGN